MKKRSILMCILLSFITFGFYYIYWFVKVNNEANRLANGRYQTSGVVVILLTFITFGFYIFYWAYKQGENYDIIRRGTGGGLIFVLCNIFGIQIVCLALLQDLINQAVEE